MARLSGESLLVLVLAAVFMAVTTACSDSSPSPIPPSVETRASGEVTPPVVSPEQSPTSESATASDCRVGQALSAEESCTYPGTSEEFSVDASGVGRFLFFSAQTVISARNALINGQLYDFAASRQDDGSWVVEVVGDSSKSVRVSDLVASATEAPAPTAASALAQAPASTPSSTPTSSPAPTQTPAPMSTHTPTPVPTATPTVAPTSVPTIPSTPSITPTLAPTHTPSSVPTATPMAAPASVPTTVPTPMLALTPGLNQPPQVVAGIPDQILTVYDSLVMEVAQAFRDPDGDQVGMYRLTVANPVVAEGRINSVTGEMTLAALDEGSSWITLTACDAQSCSSLGDLRFLLTVKPLANRPPQAVHAIDDQSVRVGESVLVRVEPAFFDIESDRIVDYRVRLDDDRLASAAFDSFTRRIRLSGIHQGRTKVMISACDRNSCGDGHPLIFTLTVKPPANRPPQVVGLIPDQIVKLGDSIRIDLASVFSDPDGDDVQAYQFFQANRDVVKGTINSKTGSLTLRAVEIGTTKVAVNASDGRLRTDIDALAFNFTVTPPIGYLPSVVHKTLDQDIEVGETTSIQVSRAFDTPDRHRIIRYDFLIEDEEVAKDAEISRQGVLTLTGSEEGRSWVSARACNSLGCSEFSDLEFVLTVAGPETPPNRSPEVVGAINDRSVIVGESVRMNVSPAFSDPDDDAIVEYRYRMSSPNLASGSSITNTGILVLRGSNVGTTSVGISACDSEYDCSDPEEMKFTLTIEAPHQINN